tara:strand:+ start:2044 stop:2364 length:321 start_codon:yes stop_codon:yes gene_type:complete
MTLVPTETQNAVYQTRDGKQHDISKMNVVELMTALHDMLMRKAKHNHKLNKMFEVGDTLGAVTKTLHQELATREACSLGELVDMQIEADLGRLKLQQTDTSITITS